MELLTAVPIAIEGEWKAVSQVGSLLWEGVATADEPITALALAEDAAGSVLWGRAQRGKAQVLPVSFRVSPLDGYPGASVFSVHIGGGAATTSATLTSAAPFQFSLTGAQSGTTAWLARIRTVGKVRLGALFVAEVDTRSARNHLWHLTAGKCAVTAELTAALSYGSRGRF